MKPPQLFANFPFYVPENRACHIGGNGTEIQIVCLAGPLYIICGQGMKLGAAEIFAPAFVKSRINTHHRYSACRNYSPPSISIPNPTQYIPVDC